MNNYEIKILVVIPYGIGDCVCTIPMLALLKKNFPKSYLAVLVRGKENREVFCHSRIKIDQYYYMDMKHDSITIIAKNIINLRNEKFDYGILPLLMPKWKGKLFFHLLQIKNVIGEQYQLENLCSKKHLVERNLFLLTYLNCFEKGQLVPRLYPNNLDLLKIKPYISKAQNKKIIVVNIGGGDSIRYHGNNIFPKYWRYMDNFVRQLVKKGYLIILLGGILEKRLRPLYQDLIRSNKVIDCIGNFTISESISLLSIADVSIGVDTGMQHVAAAVGTPTVTIFGPTDPRICGPYERSAVYIVKNMVCQYCFGNKLWYSCRSRKCLEEVSIESVLNEVISVLEK